MLMADKEVEITPGRIIELLSNILKQEFRNEPERQEVLPKGKRINFSCPYCGDSQDAYKKRGNFYLESLTYKCYNGGCVYSNPGSFRTIWEMLEDFKLTEEVDPLERAGIINAIREGKKNIQRVSYDISIDQLIDEDLKTLLVPRSLLMKKMGLEEIPGTPLENYLNKRFQFIDKKYAGDSKRN